MIPRIVRLTAIATWACVNGVLIGYAVDAFLLRPGSENDWLTWHRAAVSVGNGTLYDGGVYVWSPIAAWTLREAVLPLGYGTWVVLHLAVVLLLRDWRLGVLVVTSGAFWIDAMAGNFFTFVFVAGYLAYRGSRVAGLVFVALSLLMPRPVQVPLLIWLLVQRPPLRLPVAVMTAVSLALVFISGYAFDWATALLRVGQAYPFSGWNVGPTRFLGPWWLVVGLPLAAWLTWRGKVGWAGLAMSIYVVPQYLLMALLHLPNGKPKTPNHAIAGTDANS